ncbi:heparinase II/III domain-containing protein [Anaeromyxobacter paludicola]|uniref:Heparinase II/III-like protein n=1 Tax=Anaeromyxobacter paludicola TaxID=2918171 RepID=A0ABN6NBV5_9BACT|nr:heparinase II/III family protein [Anaeromyxobacter paludicola]BDG09427.1 hypothetical protein AMPC_25400 [Anaeromyxobacter paludicola]
MDLKRTCLLLALVAAPLSALGADHPHLFFSGGDVGGLQARASGTHKALADNLTSATSQFFGTRISSSGVATWPDGHTLSIGDMRDVGNSLVVFAFDWQLTQDPQALALAKGWLTTVASWGNYDLDGTHDLVQAHLLAGTAVAYDLLYGQLSAAEQSSVRSALVNNAAALMAAGKGGIWWEGQPLQNHDWINHAAIGLAGLAIDGEPGADQSGAFVDYAAQNAKQIQAAVAGITDGTWHEGFSYLSYGYQWHLPFVDALKRAGKGDLTDLAVLKGEGAARAYAQIPETPWTYVLSNGDFSSFMPDEGLLPLRFAASRYGDGVAQAAADRWAQGAKRTTYAPEINQAVFEFLYWDPSVKAADLSTQPLDWYGADSGSVIFRSGFDQGATLFALKCGTFGGRTAWQRAANGDLSLGGLNFSHDHADDCGFYLYGNGNWLAPEAEGYYIGHADSPGPAANATAFHNSLLIDGQGQLGEGVRANGDDASRYGWFGQREGKIAFHGSSAHFAYATADGSKLYDPAKGLTRWDRHALFLDRKYVILRDVVEASSAHDFGWLSHFTTYAGQDGSWIHGAGENGQDLGVAVVAPAGASMSFDTQSPVHGNNFDKSGNFAAATVHSGSTSAATFLTALVPTANGAWGSRPQVVALDPGHADAGLTLTAGDLKAVAIFANDGGSTQEAGGFKLAGRAGVVEYQGGALNRVALIDGQTLSDGQRALVDQSGGAGKAAMIEAEGLSSGTVTVTGEQLATATFYAPQASKVLWYGKEIPFQRQGDLVKVQFDPPLQGAGSAGSTAGAATAGAGADATAGKSGGGCSAGGSGLLSAIPIFVAGWLRRRRKAKKAAERAAREREDQERRAA